MIRSLETKKTSIVMKQPENIKELFSYRLNRLAFLSSTLAESINQDLFDLDKQGWRFIGLLAAFAPMSLKMLAKEANIDKSRASKAVASLYERGLIQRRNSDSDGRSIQLSLSEEGEKLYASAFPIALRRNNEILDVLTEAEKEQFDLILEKLIFRTKILMDLHPRHKTSASDTGDK
ncbi:MarR family winged helix-turn-helix transcriptional regulator [Advenella kashmirensis]|nr:MarR family transcriptional regulator [Advenella kashmirensis]